MNISNPMKNWLIPSSSSRGMYNIEYTQELLSIHIKLRQDDHVLFKPIHLADISSSNVFTSWILRGKKEKKEKIDIFIPKNPAWVADLSSLERRKKKRTWLPTIMGKLHAMIRDETVSNAAVKRSRGII